MYFVCVYPGCKTLLPKVVACEGPLIMMTGSLSPKKKIKKKKKKKKKKKERGCSLIRACSLIRSNTVVKEKDNNIVKSNLKIIIIVIQFKNTLISSHLPRITD